MIGYAATSAISAIDGDTMKKASLFSERPRERRRAGAPVATVAASMALEGAQRLRDLGVRLLDRRGGVRLTRQRVVDVLVDGLRDLRIDRRHRAGDRLRDALLELSGERNRLLDRRVVVDVVADRGQAVLRRVGLLDLRRADELDE